MELGNVGWGLLAGWTFWILAFPLILETLELIFASPSSLTEPLHYWLPQFCLKIENFIFKSKVQEAREVAIWPIGVWWVKIKKKNSHYRLSNGICDLEHHLARENQIRSHHCPLDHRLGAHSSSDRLHCHRPKRPIHATGLNKRQPDLKVTIRFCTQSWPSLQTSCCYFFYSTVLVLTNCNKRTKPNEISWKIIHPAIREQFSAFEFWSNKLLFLLNSSKKFRDCL